MSSPRRRAAFAVVTVVISTLAAIGLFEPVAGGLGVDQTPPVDVELPPYVDSVFDEAALTSDEMLLRDPLLLRGRPLVDDLTRNGPHDLLGFRNPAVSPAGIRARPLRWPVAGFVVSTSGGGSPPPTRPPSAPNAV